MTPFPASGCNAPVFAGGDAPAFDFDGATYKPELDKIRLNEQLARVVRLMKDSEWRSLGEIAEVTGDPEASVSARLRDLRKNRFGFHTVERKRISKGLHRYKLTLNPRFELILPELKVAP